jgi:hypothetical protein
MNPSDAWAGHFGGPEDIRFILESAADTMNYLRDHQSVNLDGVLHFFATIVPDYVNRMAGEEESEDVLKTATVKIGQVAAAKKEAAA